MMIHNASWLEPKKSEPSRRPLIWPHPLLTSPVPVTDREYPVDELKAVAAELVGIMQARGAVGLAANQVGYGIRMFVMQADPKEDPEVFLNPSWQVIPARPEHESPLKDIGGPKMLPADPGSKEVLRAEGCLSLPGYEANVTRWDNIFCCFLDLDGWKYGLGGSMEKLEGMRARIFQHEVDHLNGTALPDKLGPVARNQVKRKMAKLQKKGIAT